MARRRRSDKGVEQPSQGTAVEVHAEITANVWQVRVEVGQTVAAGDELVILESMKMEIPVITETPDVVRELYVVPEQVVQEGDLIALIDES